MYCFPVEIDAVLCESCHSDAGRCVMFFVLFCCFQFNGHGLIIWVGFDCNHSNVLL